MAKGNWRNWEEIDCAGGCGKRLYKKYAIMKHNKYYCWECAGKSLDSPQEIYPQKGVRK